MTDETKTLTALAAGPTKTCRSMCPTCGARCRKEPCHSNPWAYCGAQTKTHNDLSHTWLSPKDRPIDRRPEDTEVYIQARDMGGCTLGTGWAPRVTLNIPRIFGTARDGSEDEFSHAFRFRSLCLADRFWAVILTVEHHEWLHALMHRWRIQGWTSNPKVENGTELLIRNWERVHGILPGPFNESDMAPSPQDGIGAKRDSSESPSP